MEALHPQSAPLNIALQGIAPCQMASLLFRAAVASRLQPVVLQASLPKDGRLLLFRFYRRESRDRTFSSPCQEIHDIRDFWRDLLAMKREVPQS